MMHPVFHNLRYTGEVPCLDATSLLNNCHKTTEPLPIGPVYQDELQKRLGDLFHFSLPNNLPENLLDETHPTTRQYRSLVRALFRSDAAECLKGVLVPDPRCLTLHPERVNKSTHALLALLSGSTKVDIAAAVVETFHPRRLSHSSFAPSTLQTSDLEQSLGKPLPFLRAFTGSMYDKRLDFPTASRLLKEMPDLDTFLDEAERTYFMHKWIYDHAIHHYNVYLFNQKMRNAYADWQGSADLETAFKNDLANAWAAARIPASGDFPQDVLEAVKGIEVYRSLVDFLTRRYCFLRDAMVGCRSHRHPHEVMEKIQGLLRHCHLYPVHARFVPHRNALAEKEAKFLESLAKGGAVRTFIDRSGLVEIISLEQQLRNRTEALSDALENDPADRCELLRRMRESGYYFHDDVVSLVLRFDEPDLYLYAEETLNRSLYKSKSIQYQYSGISTVVMDAILRYVALSQNDVVYDVGSGYGRLVAYMASQRSDTHFKGIEVVPKRHQKALDLKNRLNLDQATFSCEDALEVDVSDGTVFILFNPFSTEQLELFLKKLRRTTKDSGRPIRIISFASSNYFLATCGDWLTLKKRIRIFEFHGESAGDSLLIFESF